MSGLKIGGCTYSVVGTGVVVGAGVVGTGVVVAFEEVDVVVGGIVVGEVVAEGVVGDTVVVAGDIVGDNVGGVAEHSPANAPVVMQYGYDVGHDEHAAPVTHAPKYAVLKSGMLKLPGGR